MRRSLRLLSLLAVLAPIAALTLAGSGLIPVAARGGHWAATEWFLHYAMRRSVQQQARFQHEPELNDAALIRRGAATYAVSCVGCHGAPGIARAQAATLMTPPAPELAPVLRQWRSRELFWIVKNGIKYTAMPAWAAQQRDDEVWAMVAFLQQLPVLEAAGYRALAYGADAASAYRGPVTGPATLSITSCFQCHGADGGGRDGTAPVLAGQSAAYLAASLRAYADGLRHSGIMQPIAGMLDEHKVRAWSRRFADLPLPAPQRDSPQDSVLRGERLARAGRAEHDVPPCEGCHAPDAAQRHALYPRLDGQDRDYLYRQLRLFAAGQRGGTAAAGIMAAVVRDLSDEDMRALADYYAASATNREIMASAAARPEPRAPAP